MNTTGMTKEEITKRLAEVEAQLEKYFNKADVTDPAIVKSMSARAFDALISERDRLKRSLA